MTGLNEQALKRLRMGDLEWVESEVIRTVDKDGKVVRRTRQAYIRNKHDSRLFESLTGTQRQAFECIESGHRLYVTFLEGYGFGCSLAQMGYKQDRVDNGRSDWEPLECDLVRKYLEWRSFCPTKPRLVCERVIELSESVNVASIWLGLSPHTGKKRLLEGLDCYCEVRGW